MDGLEQTDSSQSCAKPAGKPQNVTKLSDSSSKSNTSSEPDNYLHKFLNTNFVGLDQSNIDYIALVLKQNNLINDDDWCKKTQPINESEKPESFYWRIYCLLHNPKTAKLTYDILLDCLYSCNIPLAHNLENVSSTRSSNYTELDNIDKIAALIEFGKTDMVMWKYSNDLTQVEGCFQRYKTKCEKKFKEEDLFLGTNDQKKLNIMWFK